MTEYMSVCYEKRGLAKIGSLVDRNNVRVISHDVKDLDLDHRIEMYVATKKDGTRLMIKPDDLNYVETYFKEDE